MTEFEDVEVIKAHDPETGEQVEAVVVPAGYFLCLIRPETVERFKEWTEVKAVRIATSGDGTVAALEVSDDEDWLTDPEAQS